MRNELIFEQAVPVNPDFIAQATMHDDSLYQLAVQDPQAYWHMQAQQLTWFDQYHTVMQGEFPHTQWFVGGTLNLSYNCLDRHMPEKADVPALLCVNELGQRTAITYGQLHEQVQRCASALKALGVHKGDRVALYMPMIHQSVVAMLACARIGAIHTVVFAGFSAQALAHRLQDAGCRVIITADGFMRKGKVVALKDVVDVALQQVSCVQNVIVVQQGVAACSMQFERDLWYDELLAQADSVCPAEPLSAQDPAFILYTSGTTGKPKGVVHAVGGYAVGAHSSMRLVFDPQPQDRYWCTADIGWITGHTYVVYGPLMHGMTQLLYEGALSHPHQGIAWQLIEQEEITILYTAPTAIRMFGQWGNHLPQSYNLSSLRLLGSVGEPLNPEAWRWYYIFIGGKRCPIVDTWWQTETGSIMICSIPSLHAMKPGCVGKPLPAMQIELINDMREHVSVGSGFLSVATPWPSMMRGLWADEERFRQTYFPYTDYRGYVTGDAAYKDAEGDIMVLGRVDDVLNISGHRIGTMEVESAALEHPLVAEAAAVGQQHAVKGQALILFVTLKQQMMHGPNLPDAIAQQIVCGIGALARPDKVIICADLPKTRSGKIMRRLLHNVVNDCPLTDVTTLADEQVLATIVRNWQMPQATTGGEDRNTALNVVVPSEYRENHQVGQDGC